MTFKEIDAPRIRELIEANRILADQNVLDGFGHVSVRSADNPKHFFQSCSRAPALVAQADIREFDENSEPLEGRTERLYSERYIHGEIYRVRPDVQAVVHSHSFGVIPFGVSDVPLQPVCHQAGFLRGGPTPVFEIRDAAGEKNAMLITNNALGAAVARSLGERAVVLMRGHGDTVVAGSLRQLVFRAIYTEVNARLALEALRLGSNVTYMNDFEAEAMESIEPRVVDRPWEIWRSRIEAGL